MNRLLVAAICLVLVAVSSAAPIPDAANRPVLYFPTTPGTR